MKKDGSGSVVDPLRLKLIEYIGDPKNPFPNRTQMREIVGMASSSGFYNHFSPADLSEIEREGLELRRRAYSRTLAKVDKSLLKKAAKDGDVGAAKLAYQRFEDWKEGQVREFQTGKEGIHITVKFVDGKKDEK